MAVLLAFAFVSGIITILSPCILPVLPIVLSGSLGGGKARPFGVLAGFVVSFTVFTLTLSAIVQAIGISPDALRIVAVAFIGLFGAVMLVPKLHELFERLASRVARLGAAGRQQAGGVPERSGLAGLWSGLPVGASLGLIWTPCVGPIMASVISLAITRRVDGGSVFITLAYTLGTAIPMLAIMLGGRALLTRLPFLTRNAGNIQRAFGVLMILVGVGVGLGWDRRFQAAVLQALPGYGAGLTAVEETAPVREAIQARGAGREGSGEPAPAAAAAVMASGRSAGKVFSGAPAGAPENDAPGDYGLAPPLVAGGRWFNTEGLAEGLGLAADDASPPAAKPAGAGPAPEPGAEAAVQASAPALRMEDLRGRVVLVDFWTYSCVNCVRTIPYLQAWHRAYRDQGLVIIGVHTPEFEFEKNPANVERAIRDLGVEWPVVQDNDYRQWDAYGNRYWPAHYLIDTRGRVRWFHFGEGRYKETERIIQSLLGEAGGMTVGRGLVSRPDPRFAARTPETYLGYWRSKGFTSVVGPVYNRAADYRPAERLDNGQWTLAGKWVLRPQYIEPEDTGTLELGFQARNVFLVVEPESPGGRIEVRVDGRPAADTPDVKGGVLRPDGSRLYQLVGLEQPGAHVLRLEVSGRLRLFAFTFG